MTGNSTSLRRPKMMIVLVSALGMFLLFLLVVVARERTHTDVEDRGGLRGSDYPLREQQEQTERALLFWNPPAPKIAASIPLDLYRTYETKTTFFGLINYREHSISQWRLHLQVFYLNHWYKNYLSFAIQNIFEIEAYHVVEDGCAASEFAKIPDGENGAPNRKHISVIFPKQMPSHIPGCACGIGVPLGNSERAPVAVVAMSLAPSEGNWLFQNFHIGLTSIGGYVISHEVGHVLGLVHTTSSTSEEVFEKTLSDCGTNSQLSGTTVKYPCFDHRSSGNNTIVGSDGITYENKDWLGKSNLMAEWLLPAHLWNFWNVGIFRGNYIPEFESILACWWGQSESNLATTGS